MEIVLTLWMLSGIHAHVVAANDMKTWRGTPVWREPTTYVMFIPAALGGPIIWIFYLIDRKR
jgi:hypothetical protein